MLLDCSTWCSDSKTVFVFLCEPGDFALLHLSYQTPKYDVAFLKSKIFEKKLRKRWKERRKFFFGGGVYIIPAALKLVAIQTIKNYFVISVSIGTTWQQGYMCFVKKVWIRITLSLATPTCLDCEGLHVACRVVSDAVIYVIFLCHNLTIYLPN